MSKERLEEIHENAIYNSCGSSGGLLSVELKHTDYYTLLNEAKRAQELEKENKRYRKALEKIATKKNMAGAIKTAKEALEGEE